jgi:hypothetical protein
MQTFAIGKTYTTTSICNSDCVYSYKVVKRTAATVTMINKFGVQKTYRINKKLSEYRNAETILPEGNYSMCPILSADKEVA